MNHLERRNENRTATVKEYSEIEKQNCGIKLNWNWRYGGLITPKEAGSPLNNMKIDFIEL